MSDKIFVRPGLTRLDDEKNPLVPRMVPMAVRNPQRPGKPHIPPEGDWVKLDKTIRRRLHDKDLVRVPDAEIGIAISARKAREASEKAAKEKAERAAAKAKEETEEQPTAPAAPPVEASSAPSRPAKGTSDNTSKAASGGAEKGGK